MLKKIQKIWKNPSIQSTKTTSHCRICFKEINDLSFYSFSHKENILCEDCFSKLKAKFIRFDINSIEALAVYDYDDMLQKLIYTYKGCYDYELKDVFLTRYLTYFRLLYKGYVVVPAPSSKIDDEKRGFNHVEEIYKSLNLPIIHVLRKTTREKQSSKTSKDRLKVEKIIEGFDLEKLKGKNVLIVDDIYTTGSTIKRAIEIVKKGQPKKIKVMVIAKTIDLDKREKNEY